MKNIARVFFSLFVFCSFAFGVSTTAYSKPLTYEQALAKAEQIPTFIGNCRAQYSIMQDRTNLAMKYVGSIDQERQRQSAIDLAHAYMAVKETLKSYDDLWVTYFLLEVDHQVLLEFGWTQHQIDSAQPIKKKIAKAYKELKKITEKHIDLYAVEMLLLRANFDSSLIA